VVRRVCALRLEHCGEALLKVLIKLLPVFYILAVKGFPFLFTHILPVVRNESRQFLRLQLGVIQGEADAFFLQVEEEGRVLISLLAPVWFLAFLLLLDVLVDAAEGGDALLAGKGLLGKGDLFAALYLLVQSLPPHLLLIA
jgi:hypothetical protein